MIINSILDTDTYTFSVGEAIQKCFPKTLVKYGFTNRTSHMTFSQECFEAIKDEILNLGNLRLTNVERDWVLTHLDFLSEEYVAWVRDLRLDPATEVDISLSDDGQLNIDINGEWSRTIFYEVPILAIISECYFKYMDKDWNYAGQIEQHKYKADRLSQNKCIWADFSTRRRRSFASQEHVISTMAGVKGFVGTSNVYFAMVYGLKSVGTQSHQWVMGVSALRGLRHANHNAMYNWVKTFDADLGIVLPDTFGTDAFFEDFDLKFAKTFDGIRHDSGCPKEFTDKVIAHYKKLGIDPTTKTIIFSDGLDVETACFLNGYCEGRIRCSFGIGTNFSNDYKRNDGSKSEALSIVIKLRRCDGIEVVKLSDNPAKAIGDRDAIRVAKWTFFNQPLDQE